MVDRQNAERQEGRAENLDAHDFLSYCLLLKAMQRRFDEDNRATWFDDCLFFLRGGYTFFCYLNLASDLRMRGRIFGGLNHAHRPEERLRVWLNRIVSEAMLRNINHLDIFVAEEINSGSSAHRFLNIVRDHLRDNNGLSTDLTIRFVLYLACTDESIFDPNRFAAEARSKRHYRAGAMQVFNEFRLFRGSLFTYDAERYSGLRRISRETDSIERYLPIRYQTPEFLIRCPTTGNAIYDCIPGENDLAKAIGVLILNLVNINRERISYEHINERVIQNHCQECSGLFSSLRATQGGWTSTTL